MRWIILALLFILYVINFADKSVLGLAADPIMRDLSLDFNQFGVAGSSFYWFYAIGAIVLASLTIKFGTKRLLMLIAFGWTISLASALFVTSLTGLIVIRILLGFFEGGTLALCLAHIAKWFADGARGTANAILLSGATFGAYVTAPILVSLISSMGWRTTFASLGAASFLWLLVFVFFKEEPKNVTQPEVLLDSKNKTTIKNIIGVALSPYFLSILVAFFTVMWLIAWVVVWGPTYLTKIVGLSPEVMSMTFVGIGVVSGIVPIIIGKLTDRAFEKNKNVFKTYVRVSIIALLVSLVGLLATTVVTTPIFAIVFLGLAITANNCIAPFTSSVVATMVPTHQVGSLLGVKTALGSTSGIIAPLVTGALVGMAGENIREGFNYGVLVAVALYFISALFLFLASKKEISNVRKKDAQKLALS